MNQVDIDEICSELEEIEAILGIFASLEEDVQIRYIAQIASDYHEKIINLKNKIKKSSA